MAKKSGDSGTYRVTEIIGTSKVSWEDAAKSAVETAENAKSFGPLPAGYVADYLQISFLFTPRPLP